MSRPRCSLGRAWADVRRSALTAAARCARRARLPPRARPRRSRGKGPRVEFRGHEVQWPTWRLRVGFTPREDLVLHTVAYDDQGRLRPNPNTPVSADSRRRPGVGGGIVFHVRVRANASLHTHSPGPSLFGGGDRRAANRGGVF